MQGVKLISYHTTYFAKAIQLSERRLEQFIQCRVPIGVDRSNLYRCKRSIYILYDLLTRVTIFSSVEKSLLKQDRWFAIRATYSDRIIENQG